MIKLIPYLPGGNPLYLSASLISGIQHAGGNMTIVWAGGIRYEVQHTPKQIMDAMQAVKPHNPNGSLFGYVFGDR
jgi:hypothetical protein